MDLSIDGTTWNKLKVGESGIREVEQTYVTSDRTEAFCDLLETLLAESGDLPEGVAEAMRLRLVTLYDERLRNPERALAHLEILLGGEQVAEVAFDLAQSLLMRRAIAPRVAAALSDAYRRLGQPAEEMAPLTLELQLATPPRLREVKRRLAFLRLDADDPEGALELFNELFMEDPTDQEVRARFFLLRRARVEAALPPGVAADARPRELLLVLSEALGYVEQNPEHGATALDIAGFGLEISARYAPDTLAGWLTSVEQLLHHGSSAARVELFARALDRAAPSPELQRLELAAVHAFMEAGADDKALAICLRAFESRSGSPELALVTDRLLARAGEPLPERLTRLRGALASAATADSRADLHLAIGRILRDEQGDITGALDSFESAIAERSTDADAHLSSVAIHAELMDNEAMERALARLLEAVQGSTRETTLLETTRALSERGAYEAALALGRRMLEEYASDPVVLESVEILAERTNELELQRRALEARIQSVPPGEERAGAYDRLGEFLAERAHDPVSAANAWKAGAREAEAMDDWGERSRRLYERALESSQDDLEAAEKLVWSYAETQDWGEVPTAFGVLLRAAQTEEELARCVKLLLDLSERATQSRASREFAVMADEVLWRTSASGVSVTPEARALKLAKARVLGSDPARADEAAETYRSLIDSHGKSEDAAEFRSFVERQDGTDWRATELAWIFEWLSAHAERPALPLIEWARLQETEFGNPEAAQTVYERVVALEPQNRDALEDLLRIRRTNDDVEGMEACLAELIKRTPVPARHDLELQRAELLIDRLGRPDEGLAVIVQTLEAAPDHPGARERFRAFYQLDQAAISAESADLLLTQALALGDLDLAIQGYRVAAGAGIDRGLVEALGQRLLAFLDARSTDADVATRGFLAVLAAAPGTRWALDRVKLALNAAGRWQELFPLYDRAIQALEDEAERAELLNEAAVAARDLTGDAERAIGYLVQLHDLRPDDTRVEATLERLYERNGRTAELVELLLERAERLQDTDQSALRARIAGLMLDIGELERALSQIDVLVAGGATGAAETLLARLFQTPAARAGASDEETTLAEAAASRLAELYEKSDRNEELRRLRAEELEFVRGNARRLPLLRELSRLHEALPDQSEAAFEIMAELVASQPSDEDARAELDSITRRLGWYEKQVEVLLRAAAAALGMDVAAALLRDAASVCQGPLGAPERAVELYDNLLGLLERVGAPSASLVEVLRAQDSLWSRLGRSERRCAGLERLATLVETAAERRGALAEAALIASEELHDLGRAARAWQAIVDENPRDRRALDGLIAALEPGGAPEPLARALELRISRAEDAGARRKDEKALARLYADALQEEERAVAIWQKLHGDEPAERESLDALVALLERLSRFSEVVAVLEAAASVSTEPERLFRKLAAVHRQHTGDVRAAIDALLRAPDLAGAAELAATAELEDPALLFRLTSALVGDGRGNEAVRLLRLNLQGYGDRRPRERSVAHYELGRALMAIGERAEALSELKAAASIDPGNPDMLRLLGELALEHRDLEAAERSYRALLLVALHPNGSGAVAPARAEIYVRLSRVAELRGEADRAEELVASAFEAAAESAEEHRALVTTLCRVGQDELLLRALSQTEQPSRSGQELLELVRDRLEHGTPGGALAGWFTARSDELIAELLKAKNKKLGFEVWRPLLTMLRMLGQKDKLGGLLRTLAVRYAKSSVGAELEIEAAELMLDEPDRRGEAVDSLLRAWEEDPAEARVASLLKRVLAEDGRTEELVKVLRGTIAAVDGSAEPAVVAGLWLELARVFEQANEPEQAFEIYQVAARISSPERLTALRAAARIASRDGSSKRLCSVLEAELDLEHGAEAADTAVKLYELYMKSGELEDAERVLVVGLVADPSRLELSEALVRLHLERGQHGSALDLLERALKAHSGDRGLLMRYVSECIKAGAPDRALRVLEPAMEQTPDDAELERLFAAALRAASQWERALGVLERLHARGEVPHEELLSAITESDLASVERSWAFREIELLTRHRGGERARQRLSEWVASHPDDTEALRDLARMSKAARAWPDAISAYERLIALEPSGGNLSLSLELADTCERAGEAARCLPELERLWEGNKSHAELRRRLERLYASAQRYDRLAQLLLEEAEQESASAKRIELLTRASDLFMEAGSPAQAIAPLEQALALSPGKLQTLLLLCRAENAAGQGDVAIARLEQLLQAPKTLKAPEIGQVHEELAKLHLERDELVEAFDSLVLAHRLNRSSLRVAWLLGTVAMDLDDHRTAASPLRLVTTAPKTATDVTPRERSIAYLQLALIDYQKGSESGAQKLLKKALQEDPNNPQALALMESLRQPMEKSS